MKKSKNNNMVCAGALIEIEGELFAVSEVNKYDNSKLKVIDLNADNPEEKDVDLAEVILYRKQYRIIEPMSREYVFIHDWALLAPQKRAEINRKYDLFMEIERFRQELVNTGSKNIKRQLVEFCKLKGISIQTYYNWKKVLSKTNGAKVGLMRKPRIDKGLLFSRIDRRAKEIMEEVMKNVLNTALAPDLSKAYDLVQAAIKRKNGKLEPDKKIKIPCQKTFWAYVVETKRIPGLVNRWLPEGLTKKELDEIQIWYDNVLSKTKLPLDCVLLDHHLIDLILVDPITRKKIGKPWLTLLFDCNTKAILGFYLSIEEPSTNSVQMALFDAIFRKPEIYLKEKCACKHDWPMYGTPVMLSLDNAWAHKSESLKHLAREIALYGTNAINLMWRPPYKARRGALIERLFGTLETQLIHVIPGTTKSNPAARGDYDSEGEACMMLEDLKRLITRWIVDYYHQQPRKDLNGLTPVQQWNLKINELDGVSVPSGSYVKALFGVLEHGTRKVTEHGISFKGLSFLHENLACYRKKDSTGKRPEFQIRYNPWDLSTISVFYEGRYLLEAVCKEFRTQHGGLRRYSIWEWGQIREVMKERNRTHPSDIHKIYEEMWAIADLRTKEKKQMNQATKNVLLKIDKGRQKAYDEAIRKMNTENYCKDLSGSEESNKGA